MNASPIATRATTDARRIRIGGAVRLVPGPLATADLGRVRIGGAVRRA